MLHKKILTVTLLNLIIVSNIVFADVGYKTNYFVNRAYNDFNKIKGVF